MKNVKRMDDAALIGFVSGAIQGMQMVMDMHNATYKKEGVSDALIALSELSVRLGGEPLFTVMKTDEEGEW